MRHFSTTIALFHVKKNFCLFLFLEFFVVEKGHVYRLFRSNVYYQISVGVKIDQCTV